MLLRFTILFQILSLLSLALQAAPGEVTLPSQVSKELKNLPAYQEGSQAMAGKLHDVAATKFRSTLESKTLSAKAKPYVTLALAEALIRSSLSPQGDSQQALTALKLLEDKLVSKLNATPLWQAEAMASLGRYVDAEKVLSTLPNNHPLHDEVQLARSKVLLALGRVSDTLTLLVKASQSKKPAIQDKANLLASEIYIEQGRYDAATKSLERISGQHPRAAKLKIYLAARLALAEGKAAEAVSRFQSLITAPDNLTKRIFHACFLGKADAQTDDNQTEDAINTLEQFITEYPQSPLLQHAFSRLTNILPTDLLQDSPSLVKLVTWSNETPLAEDLPYLTGDSIAALRPYQPSHSEYDDLVSLALYYRAKLLTRSEDTKKHALAMALLSRLRAQHMPSTSRPSELYLKLASASLIDTAYLHLKKNNPQQATFTLAVMEKATLLPELKDQASDLRGRLLADDGKIEEALAAFESARQSASASIAEAANINAGIMALKSSEMAAFENILSSSQNKEVSTALTLERALWKCSQNDAGGRSALDAFILSHTGHPRENEARLALAAACVNIYPYDVTLAKEQLETIAPRLTDAKNQLAITRIRIRAEELSPEDLGKNWEAAAAAAEKFITDYPDDPDVPSIQLKQAEAYYHNEDYNKARLVFNELTEKYPESLYAPYASFFAAMSARLGGTAQAREECVGMFQKIIDSKHALASESRIQQSRVLIDLRRYEEAEKSLKPLLTSKTVPAAIRREAGILIAACYHQQGDTNPDKYKEAVTVYKNLLKEKDITIGWKHFIHYLLGQTLESMGNEKEAFLSYYQVIEQGNIAENNKPTSMEWKWFYRCGFKALTMLETEKRWEAAVKLARRIASFKGPRAEEADKRANSLAKTHMIWEDEDPVATNPDLATPAAPAASTDSAQEEKKIPATAPTNKP